MSLPQTPSDYIDLVRFRWPWIVAALVVGALGSQVALRFVPKQYMSQTVVLVESDKIPKSFIPQLTTDEGRDRFRTLAEEILAAPESRTSSRAQSLSGDDRRPPRGHRRHDPGSHGHRSSRQRRVRGSVQGHRPRAGAAHGDEARFDVHRGNIGRPRATGAGRQRVHRLPARGDQGGAREGREAS